MKYKKDILSHEIDKALGLEKSQIVRIKNAIQKAYDEVPTQHGFNVDNINAIVAPYIKTPEEAFYACTIILTDIMGVMLETGARPTPAN